MITVRAPTCCMIFVYGHVHYMLCTTADQESFRNIEEIDIKKIWHEIVFVLARNSSTCGELL